MHLFALKKPAAATTILGLLATGAATSCPAAGNHACDYLNRDEVARVMTTDIKQVDQHPANPMGQSICFFDTGSDSEVSFAQLQMMRSPWSSNRFKAASLFENNMSFLENLQEIQGIGEKAYWGGSGLKMGAGLHVLYQNAYFTVSVAAGDQEKNLQKCKELAALVIARTK